MKPAVRLPRTFFTRPTLTVARELLGCVLVRQKEGVRLAGRIVETEAYIGEEDEACHARAGRTRRTAIMYGPAGHAYVYFTYGMHWMLNVISEEEGFPAAVLLRALEPLEGINVMQDLRGGKAVAQLCSGPAKLTQALAIAGTENELDLCRKDSPLWIETGSHPNRINATPRIGISYAGEPWLSNPWRFLLQENPFASR